MRLASGRQPRRCAQTKRSYACKIQETTDGRRSGPRCQAWRAIKRFIARRIEKHGLIDECERTRANGECEAQEAAYPGEQEVGRKEIRCEALGCSRGRCPRPAHGVASTGRVCSPPSHLPTDAAASHVGAGDSVPSYNCRCANARNSRSSSMLYLPPRESRRPTRFRPPVRANATAISAC